MENDATLLFCVWLCYYIYVNIIFINWSRLSGQVSKHQRSHTVLWLLRRGGATTHDFLGAQPKV